MCELEQKYIEKNIKKHLNIFIYKINIDTIPSITLYESLSTKQNNTKKKKHK